MNLFAYFGGPRGSNGTQAPVREDDDVLDQDNQGQQDNEQGEVPILPITAAATTQFEVNLVEAIVHSKSTLSKSLFLHN